jgi:hypothetical protein
MKHTKLFGILGLTFLAASASAQEYFDVLKYDYGTNAICKVTPVGLSYQVSGHYDEGVFKLKYSYFNSFTPVRKDPDQTVTFSSSRTFSNRDQALAFCTQIKNKIGRTGTLTYVSYDYKSLDYYNQRDSYKYEVFDLISELSQSRALSLRFDEVTVIRDVYSYRSPPPNSFWYTSFDGIYEADRDWNITLDLR